VQSSNKGSADIGLSAAFTLPALRGHVGFRLGLTEGRSENDAALSRLNPTDAFEPLRPGTNPASRYAFAIEIQVELHENILQIVHVDDRVPGTATARAGRGRLKAGSAENGTALGARIPAGTREAVADALHDLSVLCPENGDRTVRRKSPSCGTGTNLRSAFFSHLPLRTPVGTLPHNAAIPVNSSRNGQECPVFSWHDSCSSPMGERITT
jgi:hypothetical protein